MNQEYYPVEQVKPIIEKLGYRVDYVRQSSPNFYTITAKRGYFTMKVQQNGRAWMELNIPVHEYFNIMPNGNQNLCDEYDIDYWGRDDDVGCGDFNIFGDTSTIAKFEQAYLVTFKQFVEKITNDYTAALKEMEGMSEATKHEGDK